MTRTEILAPREAEIMGRWDAGRSIEQIADALQVTRDNVLTVVHRYDDGDRDRRWRKNAEQASQQLLRAITSHQAAA